MNTKKLIMPAMCAVCIGIAGIGCQRPESAPRDTQGAREQQAEESGSARVPVEAQVTTVKVVEQIMTLTGILEPLHEVDIVSEVSGKTVRIVKQVGDRARTTDTLAVIDDRIPLSNLRQAEAQVLSAENSLKIAELNFKSDKDLFENRDISELAYENSRLAWKTAEAGYLSAQANLSLMQKAFDDTRIMSPVSGWVSRKHIDLGTMVNPGQIVYRVVDYATLTGAVGVPQASIQYIEPGSRADIVLSALPGREFRGIVKYISPQADETTGGFFVEVHVKNTPDMDIRAGMTAKIMLHLETMKKELAIPEYALVTRNDSDYVYIVENRYARLNPVRVGAKIGAQVVVESGIAAGDTIVVVGMKNLGVRTPVIIETVAEAQ